VKVFYCDNFVLPLPPGHRFPMEKYARLRERVLGHGIVRPHDLFVPAPVTDEQLQLVHTPEYVHAVTSGGLTDQAQRRIGFPWSPQLVERSRRSAGGTLAACYAALDDGVAVNLAGGTHHAFRDAGEGFCVFNDAAIAARSMQRDGCATRILIVDCDVHQGNGTAAIFRDDPTVFTFSMHGSNNYPFRKECSDLDVAFADGVEDEEYIESLSTNLHALLRSNAFDLALYVSGADPFVGDSLGRLALTKTGLAERDRIVFECMAQRGIPVVAVMAGGYARRVEDTVNIHVATVGAAARIAGVWTGRPVEHRQRAIGTN